MESGQNSILLVLGLLYACGAGLELLVRISQGIPYHVPPPFDRNVCLSVLFFVILPTVLWPPISIYRITKPLVRAVMDCFRDKVDTILSDDEDCASSEDGMDTSRDVEKGYELQDAAT